MSDQEDINTTCDDYHARKLCVIDIDDTLVHTEFQPFEGATEFRVYGLAFYSRLRPFAREFLRAVAKHFDLAIWSAGKAFYVNAVVAGFFPLVDFKFVWTDKKCLSWQKHTAADVTASSSSPVADSATPSLPAPVLCKPLWKIEERFGYSIEKIVIVDDSEETARFNCRNLLHMPAYATYEHTIDEDWALLLAAAYFAHLVPRCAQGEVGDVNKSNWHADAHTIILKDASILIEIS